MPSLWHHPDIGFRRQEFLSPEWDSFDSRATSIVDAGSELWDQKAPNSRSAVVDVDAALYENGPVVGQA
jgi:hypothetical protein